MIPIPVRKHDRRTRGHAKLIQRLGETAPIAERRTAEIEVEGRHATGQQSRCRALADIVDRNRIDRLGPGIDTLLRLAHSRRRSHSRRVQDTDCVLTVSLSSFPVIVHPRPG